MLTNLYEAVQRVIALAARDANVASQHFTCRPITPTDMDIVCTASDVNDIDVIVPNNRYFILTGLVSDKPTWAKVERARTTIAILTSWQDLINFFPVFGPNNKFTLKLNHYIPIIIKGFVIERQGATVYNELS